MSPVVALARVVFHVERSLIVNLRRNLISVEPALVERRDRSLNFLWQTKSTTI